jgi:crotonobetainyl-CoA:carnitine CoA-transferase CaiB-like acyl-CoA transferase
VGQVVDASHLGSMSFLQGLSLTSRLINGAAFPRVPRARAFNPSGTTTAAATTSGSRSRMLQPDRYWADFTRAIGRPELERIARFATMGARAGNCAALIEILDAAFASKPRADWLDILRKGGDFIFTIVNSLNDLPTDPQMLANDYIVDFDHPTTARPSTSGSRCGSPRRPDRSAQPAPEHGQHTEVLSPSCSATSWEDSQGLTLSAA